MQSTGEEGAGDDDATRRLETIADGIVPAPGAQELLPGTLVGHYRVERQIGSGGMGSVYRAEQLHPVRRTVALKLLRGRLSSRQRAYFEIERQTLAQMQHPAIAQIFDAGTTEGGVPWFAMEYIEGQSITGAARDMTLEERLALMARVCDAIQHAHQKGVVHRDLKPANILVTRVDGQWLPKIIDFGIATAAARTSLNDATGDDGPVDRAGTPDYMSPEQLQGRLATIDTRSDVYALGVVLFELIAGNRPNAASQSGRTASPTRATLTVPSQQLRAGGKQVAGTGVRGRRLRELDRVVLTAMAQERNDRYPSASALAAELRSFLRHMPLAVVPATPAYLMGKFARRHRLLLASAAVVLFSLVAGLVLSLHAFSQAQAQREVAQSRQKELEQVVAFQQAMLSGIDVRDMGARLLDLEREQLSRAGDPALLEHYERIAGALDGPSLARTILVDAVLKRAESTLATQFADQPVLAADLHHSVGDVYFAIGQYEDAAGAFAAVLAQREQKLGPGASASLQARVALANSLERSGEFDHAQDVIDAALTRAGDLPPDDVLRVALPMARAQLARSKLRYGEAREWYGKGLDAALQVYPADHPEVIRARQQYALSLHLDGATDEARPQFEQVLAMQRQRGDNWQQLVGIMVNYAAMLSQIGDGPAALELERDAYAIQREHSGADHPLTLMILNNLGLSMLDHGDDNEAALAMLFEAADGRARVLGPEHPQSLRSQSSKARALDRVGRHDEAVDLYRYVLSARQRLLGPASRDTIRVARSLADLLRRIGRHDEAYALLQTVHADVVAAEGEHSEDAVALDIDAGRLLATTGRMQAGEQRLLRRLQALDAADDIGRYDVAYALFRTYRDAGRADDAARLREQYLQPLLDSDAAELDPRLRPLRGDVAAELAAPAPPS